MNYFFPSLSKISRTIESHPSDNNTPYTLRINCQDLSKANIKKACQSQKTIKSSFADKVPFEKCRFCGSILGSVQDLLGLSR